MWLLHPPGEGLECLNEEYGRTVERPPSPEFNLLDYLVIEQPYVYL